MGRSVSVASGAELIAYKTYDTEDEFAYDDLVEDVRSYLESKYPSLERIEDKWLDREDRVLLENRLVSIGISEYCGLVSVWVVPKEDYPDLTAKFIKTIAPYFEEIGELKKVGTFSNGEGVYERVSK